MDKAAKKALCERMQDDAGFREYMDETLATMQRHLDVVVSAAPGAVAEPALRELIGQLRVVKTLHRDLLGVDKSG